MAIRIPSTRIANTLVTDSNAKSIHCARRMRGGGPSALESIMSTGRTSVMPGWRIALIGLNGQEFYEINRDRNKKGRRPAPFPHSGSKPPGDGSSVSTAPCPMGP